MSQYRTPDNQSHNELAAPPRLLVWIVIGLFSIIIAGGIAGVVIFREGLRPSQQQRVLDSVPFMRVFLRPTPVGGQLPTVVPGETDPMSLLTMPLDTAEPTAPPIELTITAAFTETATVVPSATPPPTSDPTLPAPTQSADLSTPDNTLQAVSDNAAVDNPGGSLPDSARIFGIVHHQQTWNNCGPATLTMALSYFGWQEDQSVAADYLKPNREDKNVGPDELVNFVNNQTGVRARMSIGGSIELLKALIANNFPVIIETGAMFEAYDWIGHYRTVVAYDDLSSTFFFYDSFMGTGTSEQGVTESYLATDENWRHFNRTFIVLYQAEDEALLQALMGDVWDLKTAAQIAFDKAQEEARSSPQDGFAWFNMGSSLTILERYEEAANAFDQSRRLGLPWRMLWYQFAPFEAYYKTGRYDDVLSLVQANLNNAEELEETYYWRGIVLAAQGKAPQAATAFRTALQYNPRFERAQVALDNLNL